MPDGENHAFGCNYRYSTTGITSGDGMGMADAEAFIAYWSEAGGTERSNYTRFLDDLCDLIGVDVPGRSSDAVRRADYEYERQVIRHRRDGTTAPNYIDLYRRGCFVLEAKQSNKRIARPAQQDDLPLIPPKAQPRTGRRVGTQWDTMMLAARGQAEEYAKSLPAEEGWPPFLIVVDIGHVIELYADFAQQGKHYAQFPDRQSYRIFLEDLRDPDIRERLRLIWTDPQHLNPARVTAEVTRDIAQFLARLSLSMETRMIRALPKDRRPEALAADRRAIAEKVSLFLMRCLFTMFAEDVGLLKKESFTALLESYRGQADKAHFAMEHLWNTMNRGGFSVQLQEDVMRFNGGLFRDATALVIDEDALNLLIMASKRDWKDVEPAIFGTLLERALDPNERHKLGAHYTPRAYVERLVVATIIEPLTEDWRNVQASAAQYKAAGDDKKALAEVQKFHRQLCETRVLDPACGTGNFLYVAMELMKRLEGEVLESLLDLGDTQPILTVDPHTFLGLELNPRAVAIAELVLWIGYLQWHFRTQGRSMPTEPVLKNFRNIVEQDAVLAYDSWDVLRDETGRPITRWDGITYKLHPITGEQVPDEAATMELRRYIHPRAASWPDADFIVGNPPFIGGKDMRQELSGGYAEACWKARPHIPGAADFVMHFWDKAAETVRMKKARRFGLITTNSITQKFSRRVIERHLSAKNPLSFVMAIPDHPWMKSADKAAVRIAMTVGVPGTSEGILRKVRHESDLNTDAPKVTLIETLGKIQSDFTVGAELSTTLALQANERLSSRGVSLHGSGFIVTAEEAAAMGLGKVDGLDEFIRPYRNGRDLAARPRGVMVIDLFGLTPDEVQERFPAVYQRILDRVKPERDNNNRASYRENWWIFGEPRRELRPALDGLSRYVVTIETSKHRFFEFLDASILPDNKLICLAFDGGYEIGVLSSEIHRVWYIGNAGKIGVYERDVVYVKSLCFDPFPFPDPPDALKSRIRDLGERLDAHRKDALAKHPHLTMTGLYNVLEKIRAGDVLTDADRDVYDSGLVGVLRQIHDDLDAAVAEAYGWPADLSDADILERLVALNHERAAEEARGQIRWLRPEFQAPDAAKEIRAAKVQDGFEFVAAEGKGKKPNLPAPMPERVAAIRAALAREDAAVTPGDLAARFAQGRRAQARVAEVLNTLAMLGRAEQVGDRYVSLE